MEAKTSETLKSLRGDDDQLDPPAGRDALRRPAAVGRGRPGGDVELAARHPRRADRRARRRPDRAGARSSSSGSPSRGSRSSSSRTTSTTSSRPRTGSPSCASAANVGVYERAAHDAGGGRARDHGRRPDQGLRDSRHRERGACMTAATAGSRRRGAPSSQSYAERARATTSAPATSAAAPVIIALGDRRRSSSGCTAQNFATPGNFTNIITQMAGTCLLAYGVVFVLLIGEIDLSVGFVSGVAGVVVALLQHPAPDRRPPARARSAS